MNVILQPCLDQCQGHCCRMVAAPTNEQIFRLCCDHSGVRRNGRNELTVKLAQTRRYNSPPFARNSSALSCIPASAATCSAAALSLIRANSRTSCEIFMEQNCGPHMEQKCADLWASLGRVSS